MARANPDPLPPQASWASYVLSLGQNYCAPLLMCPPSFLLTPLLSLNSGILRPPPTSSHPPSGILLSSSGFLGVLRAFSRPKLHPSDILLPPFDIFSHPLRYPSLLLRLRGRPTFFLSAKTTPSASGTCTARAPKRFSNTWPPRNSTGTAPRTEIERTEIKRTQIKRTKRKRAKINRTKRKRAKRKRTKIKRAKGKRTKRKWAKRKRRGRYRRGGSFL